MKLSDLTPHSDHAKARRASDPEYAAEVDRLRLADAVSVAVVKYRAEKNLSQTQFAAAMGWKQPQVARLERGDVQPSISTLERLARAGILTVHVDQHGTVVERMTA